MKSLKRLFRAISMGLKVFWDILTGRTEEEEEEWVEIGDRIWMMEPPPWAIEIAHNFDYRRVKLLFNLFDEIFERITETTLPSAMHEFDEHVDQLEQWLKEYFNVNIRKLKNMSATLMHLARTVEQFYRKGLYFSGLVVINAFTKGHHEVEREDIIEVHGDAWLEGGGLSFDIRVKEEIKKKFFRFIVKEIVKP